MGELFFFVTYGSYLIIPFVFDAPETESIYMIRDAHFVYLNILESIQVQNAGIYFTDNIFAMFAGRV
jgi:hypothetical protein